MGSVVTLKASITSRAAALAAAGTSRPSTQPARVRLTEVRIEAIPIPSGLPTYTYDLDVPGLAVRVTPRGVRTFVMVKKIAGKSQRVTLGRWPGLKLAEARKAASRINGEVAAGLDPVAARKAARIRAETCSDFWPVYLAHIKRKNRAWRRDEQRWTTDVAPSLGRKPLISVGAMDCQKIIDRVGSDYPIKANRIAALLGAFFAHAVKCDRIVRNPARGLSRYEEAPRDRFLSATDVAQFVAACGTAPDPWGDLFALLLWTGARRSTVMAMRWDDLDLQEQIWLVPATSAKNKQPAAIPLIEPALDILRRREQTRDASPWVFPGHGRTGHVAHVAKAWAVLTEKAQLADLRPHDLRRTIGSWLAGAGANAFLIQKALTHKSAASAKAYAHLDVDAVRAALQEISEAMRRRG